MTRARGRVDDVSVHRHGPAAQVQAIAQFAQFALECREIMTTVDHGVELVAQLLGAPFAALIRPVGPDRAELVCAHGTLGPPLTAALREGFPFPAELLALTERTTTPLLVDDWEAGSRLPRPFPDRLLAVRSALLVGVPQPAEPCLLLVADTRARTRRDTEVGAAVAVAHLLAAAMERHRCDTMRAAVAAFGRFALESRSIGTIRQRAVDLATEVLDTSIGFLVRVVETDRLEVVHGRGPLGEPFDGEIDVPWHLVTWLRSAEPVVTGQAMQWSPEASGAQTTGLTVGFRAAGRIYGLGVAATDPGPFTDSEIDALQSIAHLLAVTLERDHAESRLRETSNQLQQALLPATLPQVEGIEMAARYLPAGQDQVGGDWYDVLPLPHDGVGLVVGDVEGHGGGAAAVMGQVRNVLRTYVAEGHPPAQVLSQVNRFVAAHTDLLVSCCYAELRPDDLTVTCVTAGHPVPVVLERDGRSWSLPVRPGLLLGVDPDHDYQEHTSLLPPGCCLLLVTDGLVDDGGGAVHPGQEAFRAAARALVGEPLDRLADGLATPPAGAPASRDDAALLVVRLTGSDTATSGSVGGASGGPDGDSTDGISVRRVFPPSPSASPAARRYVVDLLTRWDLAELCDAAALAVSELVTNVVMHTTSAVRLVLRRLADGVWIGVHDTNDRLPVLPRPARALDPGGRGLAIVDQVTDRWGVTPTPESGGKTVWLELTVGR